MTIETIEILSNDVVIVEQPVSDSIEVAEETHFVLFTDAPQGPAGPPGNLVWEGAWSALTQYTATSVVFYDGGSYKAVGVPLLASLPTNVTYWEPVALRGLQGVQGIQGIQGVQGVQGAQGDTGPQGSQGIQGIQGIQGDQGVQGAQGIQGPSGDPFRISKVYASVAALIADIAPTGINVGEFAIIDSGDVNDPDNARVYLWGGLSYSYITDISGATGIQGPQGVQGIQGIQGVQGDPGAPGIQGDPGVDGADGEDGNTIIYGTVNPTTEGFDGDSYINTSTNFLFGPKAAGVWPAGVSLVGPQGDQGPAGVSGVTADEAIAYAIIFGS
jgi:hypothetical protein